MMRILVTGMSGSGKSTVIARLAARGIKAVDLDDDWWCQPARVPDLNDPTGTAMEPGQRWHEGRVAALLDTEDAPALVIAGCEDNQGRFYHRLDHIVLLTAPPEVLLHRVATRATNPYGRTAVDRERIRTHIRTVEPRLRATADLELDTSTLDPDTVTDRIAALATS